MINPISALSMFSPESVRLFWDHFVVLLQSIFQSRLTESADPYCSRAATSEMTRWDRRCILLGQWTSIRYCYTWYGIYCFNQNKRYSTLHYLTSPSYINSSSWTFPDPALPGFPLFYISESAPLTFLNDMCVILSQLCSSHLLTNSH